MQDVFVVLTGVSGNLGDAVIRRRVLEWCRGRGRVHAYVGRTTPGWIEQLGLRDDEVAYSARERKVWLRRLLFGRGSRVLVFDPGEVPLGREHLKSEVLFFLIVLGLRLRRSEVIRPPRAAGATHPVTTFFHRASARLSDVVLWRDRPSLERLRVGELYPDTAFSEPAVAGVPHQERRLILVTMRGRRALPSDAWFEGIATFVRSRGLKVVAMSQVDEDEERTALIADRLGKDIAEYRPWGARSDLQQERAVRAVYEECALAISDRLHVLILAAKAGAVPVEIAPSPAPKIRTHFETIGYDGASLDSGHASSADIARFLDVQAARHEEMISKVSSAKEHLDRRISETLLGR